MYKNSVMYEFEKIDFTDVLGKDSPLNINYFWSVASAIAKFPALVTRLLP